MKTRKITLTLTFNENEINELIDAFRDAQLSLCDLAGEPRKESIGKFHWRETMENALVKTLNELKERNPLT